MTTLDQAERAIPRRRRTAWLLLLVLALTPSACQSPSAVREPAPTRAVVLPSDPLAAVVSAIRAQPKAVPFSIQTIIDSDGNQVTSSLRIESSKRIQLVSSGGSIKMVDGQCYEKIGDSPWSPCVNPEGGAAAIAAASKLLDPTITEASVNMIQSASLVATETLNGIRVRVYECAVAGDRYGVPTEGTSRFWVAEGSGLPVKQVTVISSASLDATTTLITDYDPTLTVRAP